MSACCGRPPPLSPSLSPPPAPSFPPLPDPQLFPPYKIKSLLPPNLLLLLCNVQFFSIFKKNPETNFFVVVVVMVLLPAQAMRFSVSSKVFSSSSVNDHTA